MATINNPFIRDNISVDERFNEHLATWGGNGPLYILARRIEQHAELEVGSRSVVIVADELLGNGHLINAVGASSDSIGGPGVHAGPAQPVHDGIPGGAGGAGGPGAAGGSVTVMCRRSNGVRINTSGGAGAAGGPGGNGGPGSPATSTPGGTITETVFDADGNPTQVEVPQPDIETPGTLGGFGGQGGAGGAGGNAGAIHFTSILDDTPPVLEAVGGAGGPGGPGGLTGAHGPGAVIPDDLDTTPVPGEAGTPGADGTVTVTALGEQEYVAGLRPLLDAEGRDFANHWAPYRLIVGQHFYRQDRRSDPLKGQQAATEFARTLELQSDNAEALRWQAQLLDIPRPLPVGPDLEWQPGGLNALALPRDLDVLPRFEKFSKAFTDFGDLVLQFLHAGKLLLVDPDIDAWRRFVAQQRKQAEDAHETTREDREHAETERRLATEAIASVQARLDQTTRDIQSAIEEMREEPEDIFGAVIGVASAVVAVVAAVPTGGASLVALVPSMVALTSAVVDNAEPIAKAVLAGDKANTDAVKKAYEKVDSKAADVVKGAKAIVNLVEVVQKLSASTTPDNSKHVALVRRGVDLTHELLLARHRITLAEQRLSAAEARVGRAAQAVAGIAAVQETLETDAARLRAMALRAIAIAESKADALLTLAFYAQRSLEILTLKDHEDKVKLESGHLHPDIGRDFAEEVIDETDLVDALDASWAGVLDLLDLRVIFDTLMTQDLQRDERRLLFRSGDPEVESLRATHRLGFRIDAAKLPPGQVDARARGVRLALVGAKHSASEVTCEIRHGAAYETRGRDGSITVTVLQPRSSNRDAKLDRLAADEGLGPDPLLSDPLSLAFWGRGLGGDYELSVPGHEFDAGLDLTGLTDVQVWIEYQFVR